MADLDHGTLSSLPPSFALLHDKQLASRVSPNHARTMPSYDCLRTREHIALNGTLELPGGAGLLVTLHGPAGHAYRGQPDRGVPPRLAEALGRMPRGARDSHVLEARW